MKKLLVLLVCLFSFSFASFADDDQPISYNQLPEKAQVFIRKHFQVADVTKVFMDEDGDEYEVRLRGGIKIEFGKAGRWKEVDCKRRAVPQSIVPARVSEYVIEHFGPEVKIIEISRDREEIEVKLSNGKELEFDKNNKRVKIDD